MRKVSHTARVPDIAPERQAYQLADTGHIQDNHRKKDRYKASGKKEQVL